jgi:hypothetical protein
MGTRYLQWRKRLGKAGDNEKLGIEFRAYKTHLKGLQESFLRGLEGLRWDFAVQAPSCSPHAGEFAVLVPIVASDKPLSIFAFDCQRLGQTNSATGAAVEHLESAMLPTQPLPSLDIVRRVLIVDDVYAEGKTAVAIIRCLRLHGLTETALIAVATVLRVFPSQPAAPKNWLDMLKEES